MTKALISVGIVTYNSSGDITKCLETLYRYTKKAITLDVYVFDNNSSDSKITQAIVEKNFPNVTLIMSDKNMGFGYGHNHIINRVKSVFHLIVNADVEFREDSLTLLTEYLQNNKDAVMISPEIRNTDGSVQHLPKRFPKLQYILSSTVPLLAKYRVPYTRSDENLNRPTEMEVCTGCFMLCRTKELKEEGGFDTRFFLYFEDLDLGLRMRRFGKVIYFPGTYVVHGWFRGPRSSKKLLAIQIRSMLKFYIKWGLTINVTR